MSGIMASVDQRTNLAGRNRMELLLFNLNGSQLFGINVFKVREVIRTPRLIAVPHAHPIVRGISTIRGKTISVLDLSLATTGRPLDDLTTSSVIVTEYNRTIQGFLVRSVDRIVNMNWKDIKPPPSHAAGSSYLTAVTEVDGRMVQIVDVEKVMDEVNRAGGVQDDGGAGLETVESAADCHVLVVDDSVVARRQVQSTLERIGVQVHLAKNGEEGLNLLREWVTTPDSPWKNLLLVISDIEMPKMDGYTFTTAVRNDPDLKNTFMLLHTSLSGVFNRDMVRKVGANDFLAKFSSDELAAKVVERLEARQEA